MIKKDIAYSNSYIEPKREKFQENCNENHHMSVDDIFADADRMIYEQNQSLLNQNPKKKKIQSRFLFSEKSRTTYKRGHYHERFY